MVSQNVFGDARMVWMSSITMPSTVVIGLHPLPVGGGSTMLFSLIFLFVRHAYEW